MREPPTAAVERKVCYVPMLRGGILQPLTQTNSRSSCSVEETILHWKPFLSVGGEREDLQSMLEIFLGR